MPTKSADQRFGVIAEAARSLLHGLATCQSDGERELLLVHALTGAHLDGMDAASEIANEAIARVVLERHEPHTTH